MSNLPKLETKHIAWILEVAAEGFAEKAAAAEMDIVRHTHFSEWLIATPHVSRNQDREKVIAERTVFLNQYRDILEVLRAMRERVGEISADEFARVFVAGRKP